MTKERRKTERRENKANQAYAEARSYKELADGSPELIEAAAFRVCGELALLRATLLED